MLNSVSKSVRNSLLALAARPGWRRHLAYILAGLALMFGVLRLDTHATPPSGRVTAGGMAVLLVFILLAGPVLVTLQPVFRAMGLLPLWSLLIAGVGLVTGAAYGKGRHYLQAGGATPCP